MDRPHGLESLLRRQPSDERKHGSGEVIVTVVRYHMPCTTDIDVIGVRYKLKKLFGMRLFHEFGGCTSRAGIRHYEVTRLERA